MYNKKFIPYITEKSTQQQEKGLKLTFLIDKTVNKIMIKQLMKKKYNAKNIKVHIIKNAMKKVKQSIASGL